MALWTAASGMLAQSLGAKQEVPGTRAPARQQAGQTHAAAQKERSARFLTRRGIGTAQPVYPRSPAEMLAEARAQHRALVVHPGAQANPANTPLTAPWQPVGP